MSGSHVHVRAYAVLVVILILLAGFFYAIYSSQQAVPATTLQNYPSDLPPLLPQDAAALQQPFQYLVSFTDSGFHPSALTVSAGETIRFINNGTSAVTIAEPNTLSATLAHGAYMQWQASKGVSTFSAGSFSATITTN